MNRKGEEGAQGMHEAALYSFLFAFVRLLR
jgi:hypothetical protein